MILMRLYVRLCASMQVNYFKYNIWFGNVSNCLSFEFHFEDITKFINNGQIRQ